MLPNLSEPYLLNSNQVMKTFWRLLTESLLGHNLEKFSFKFNEFLKIWQKSKKFGTSIKIHNLIVPFLLLTERKKRQV